MRVRRAAWACLLLCACGDARTSSTLELDRPANMDAAPLRALAQWRYRSPQVDVDIDLRTVDGADGCLTSAELRIDEAIAGTDHYQLPETDCEVLRLTDAGDLVLYAAPTGHDWAHEPLDVDLDRELIRLGPWHDPEADSTYRFTLAAPECEDDSDCECPVLERRSGDERLALDLGRRCD
jgi:hypothetical protein